jgi:site-specific recombinase XerD
MNAPRRRTAPPAALVRAKVLAPPAEVMADKDFFSAPSPAAPSAIVLRSPELSAEEVEGLAAAACAPSTQRAYESDLRTFAAWCTDHGYPAAPAAPATLVRYVAHLEGLGRKASTIGRAIAAISKAHDVAGHPSPARDGVVRNALRGMRRRLGIAPAKKAPVGDAELAALVGTLGEDLAGLRNRAMLTLGWFGAFRRSELVALDVADIEPAPEGLRVILRRSKTDQEGEGTIKGIPYASAPALCPVRALRTWLDAGHLEAGPIFRGINRAGKLGARLRARAVARIVQRAAARAGLDPRRYAGHSLRSGFATTAARKGKSLDAIMRQTGHRSERVARGYIRHATVFDDNAAKGLV